MSITTVPVRFDGRARRQNRRREQDKLVPTMIEALRKIAYEPFGAADASHAEVLESITTYAREILKRIEG